MATTEQFRYFIELSEHHTISEAAEALHISTAGLSISMQKLENELGLSLINRKRNAITLTKDGEKFLAALKDFFSAVYRLQHHASVQAPSVILAGKYEIYTTHSSFSNSIPGFISNLYATFPQTKFIFHKTAALELLKNVRDGKIEIAFVYNIIQNKKHLYPFFSSLFFTPLMQCKPYFHVPEKYTELISHSVLYQNDLKNHTEVFNMSSLDDNAFVRQGKMTYPYICEEDLSIFSEMMENGVGIGHTIITPYNAAYKSSFKNCVAIPQGDDIQIEFGYVSHRPELSAKNSELVAYLNEYLNTLSNQKVPLF